MSSKNGSTTNTPIPEDAPVPIAIVGAGGWGRNHVRTFASLPGAELRYVCDRSSQTRAQLELAHPGPLYLEDALTAMSDPEVRAVVVATDAPSHFEIARHALERDKDVLVEKPLCLRASDAEALCRLAEARGRIVMVGHLLLYHQAVIALRELIVSGELGEVLYLYAHRLNLGVVRRDENAWWSLAPHDISLANYLLDARPEAVSASAGTFLQTQAGIEDVVFATLHYPGGRLAHVHVSWLDPHKTRRLTVVGSKKMAVFDDTSPDQKLVLFDKGAVPPPNALSYDEGVRLRTGDIRIPAIRMSEPLRRECEAFLTAVRSRQAPLADGRSGLAVVGALEAGSRSLLERGQRIDISSMDIASIDSGAAT